MSQSVYNILWADDEIETITKALFFEQNLKASHINLLGTATNAEDLEALMKKYDGQVHAVVIDANFNRKKLLDMQEEGSRKDFSGLRYCAIRLIPDYSASIPFFLYSQRGAEELRKACEEGDELEYFLREENLDNWIPKGKGTKALYPKIIEKVDLMNSPEYQIAQRFHRELQIAKRIPKAEKLLLEGLRLAYVDDISDVSVEDLFNPLRKLVERIMAACRREKILPKIGSLNQFQRFLSNREVNPFKLLKTDLMPKALAHAFEFFLDITQDGSHGDDEALELGVDNYVSQMKSQNLFQAVLHIAMDILLWYGNVADSLSGEKLWQGDYEYDGPVHLTQIPGAPAYKKALIVGDYSLQYVKELNICEGDYIGIISTDYRNKPDRDFPDKMYVFSNQYVIIERFADQQ